MCIVCMCTCACVHTLMQVLTEARVSDPLEPELQAVENQPTRVLLIKLPLCKSILYPLLLSPLSCVFSLWRCVYVVICVSRLYISLLTCAYRDQRLMSTVFLYHYFLRKCLSLNLELACLARPAD